MRKRRIVSQAIVGAIAFGAMIFLLILMSLQLRGRKLPFEALAQGPSFYTGRDYGGQEPDFLVVIRPEGIDNPGFGVQFAAELADELRNVDYQRRFAVVVFRGSIGGMDPSYAVDILQITRYGANVVMKAHLGEPQPDEGHLHAFSSPYHVVIVPKEGTWGQEIRFVLEVDGRKVKEHTYFIP